MKTTQDNSDKLLRDKINSLDSLPEDYAPSLDSKWELLMAGMQQPAEAKIVAIEEKKEKKRFFYLYAAAACFLCLFTFGWLFLRDDKIAGNQVAIATDKPANTSAAVQEKTAVAGQGKSETAVNATNKADEIAALARAKKTGVTSKNRQALIATPKPKTAGQAAGLSVEATPQNTTQQELQTSAQPKQLLATATSAKPAKTKAAAKRKAKSVELDFEPDHVITPSQHDPQVAQQNLKFKFMPRPEGSNVAQQDNPLKVKHTF